MSHFLELDPQTICSSTASSTTDTTVPVPVFKWRVAAAERWPDAAERFSYSKEGKTVEYSVPIKIAEYIIETSDENEPFGVTAENEDGIDILNHSGGNIIRIQEGDYFEVDYNDVEYSFDGFDDDDEDDREEQRLINLVIENDDDAPEEYSGDVGSYLNDNGWEGTSETVINGPLIIQRVHATNSLEVPAAAAAFTLAAAISDDLMATTT
jgi:hypothetical protein